MASLSYKWNICTIKISQTNKQSRKPQGELAHDILANYSQSPLYLYLSKPMRIFD